MEKISTFWRTVFIRLIAVGSIVLSLVFSIVASGIVLLRHIGQILRAQEIILMHEGGFGHTIHDVDAARHHFGPNRVLFLFAYWSRFRHNPYSPRLWKDIDFIFLPVAFATNRGQRPLPFWPYWPEFSFTLLTRALRFLFSRKTIMLQNDFFDNLAQGIETNPADPGHDWIYRYGEYWRNSTMPKARLDAETEANVWRQINSHAPTFYTEENKICCIYLRNKGNTLQQNSVTRSGSDIEVYRLAINYLTDQGFGVFVVGDRQISAEFSMSVGPNVIDAKMAGVDRWLFYLFACTVCDLFIGEPGGGNWLSPMNRVPSLLINGFPYSNTMPGATVYPKLLVGRDGRIVPMKKSSPFMPFSVH